MSLTTSHRTWGSLVESAKRTAFRGLVADWRGDVRLEEGYTILLPSPMDMPFLLRLGLEGLSRVNTEHCRQIVIVPDGWGDDGAAALRAVASEFNDPRIEFVDLRRRDYWLIRSMRPPGSAATHWMQVVNGTRRARCEYAFLHDADAFFLEEEGLERQYQEARRRGMKTLGVTARWDPFFTELDYKIPGTWELMYSVRWARSRHPYELKGRRLPTPHGRHTFDSMLYPQYLDYASGEIGVTESPPEFVHFNGTIFTYRLFRDSRQTTVCDDFFRLLLLALLSDAVDPKGAMRTVPQVSDLAAGLTDQRARVRYDSPTCIQQYPVFRELLEQLCDTPMIRRLPEDSIRRSVAPFDKHFDWSPEFKANATETAPVMRVSGLG